MKDFKLFLFILILNLSSSVFAQISNPNDSLQKAMEEFLTAKNEALDDLPFEFAILSKELLSNEILENQEDGIFWFCDGSIHTTFYLLFLDGNKYSIIDLTKPFMEVTKELLIYFKATSWNDKDIIIKYFNEVINLYELNQLM